LWWLLWLTRPAPTLPNIVSWTATASGPLVLLGLAWLLIGRSSRRETERFTLAVEEMRRESSALESVLEIVGARIEANHARLRGEAEKLMTLGDEAADRLGRVTYYLAKETATLDRKAAELESAAAAAKVDIGVLMSDLPRAEEQARAVSEAMKDAGLGAHGQASALEAQLAALAARGREADEVLGGAAQRLAAHVARIESSAGTAATRIDEASAGMTASVDGAMGRAAEAVEQARTALDAQGQATLAAIEQSQAALERAGAEAAQRLSARLEEVSGKIEALAGHLSAQDAASHALVTGLAKELTELDRWFDQLGRTGTEQSEKLAHAVGTLRDGTRALVTELGAGREQAHALIERSDAMATALAGVGAQLGEIRGRAGDAAGAMAALEPVLDGIGAVSERIEGRVGEIASQVDAIAGRAQQQDEATRAMVDALVRDVAGLEENFAALEAGGGARTAELAAAIAALGEAASALDRDLGAGGAHAEALAGRARDINTALAEASSKLGEELPAALTRAEEQVGRTREAADAIAPAVGEVERLAGAARDGIAQAETALARIDAGAAGAEEKLRALGAAAAEAREAAARIAAETGPELIEALLRVREAAAQATERAREAISAVIPQAAASLEDAGREALGRAVEDIVAAQMDELSALAERSADAARRASERLTRQMLKLGETTAAIEQRIDDERRAREEKDAESFSRRVALLIESLNSTSIDVTKILSNEVTDSAWAAYLKGDRGVFTRRAVRLLDTTEAREIARHYEEEPEFREQVNRYIHDFESMLRRVLADRDGSVLGVTLLSSDMGKLYVALAQAIERLR
jgi:KaiC/GvpD/RAD55 family RecA-like ATPase